MFSITSCLEKVIFYSSILQSTVDDHGNRYTLKKKKNITELAINVFLERVRVIHWNALRKLMFWVSASTRELISKMKSFKNFNSF